MSGDIASRCEVIYITEHPPGYQGAILVQYPSEGLVNFQSARNGIASSMGLMSKRAIAQNPQVAREMKSKVIEDSLPELRISSRDLQDIIN